MKLDKALGYAVILGKSKKNFLQSEGRYGNGQETYERI